VIDEVLHSFGDGGGNLDLNLPLAQNGVRRCEPHSSRLFFGPHPHRSFIRASGTAERL
jgi:hypothetical protein